MDAATDIRPAPDREITIARDFDAPPAAVFRAWAEPRLLAGWWGPHGFSNPVCEIEPQSGGRLRIVMRGPDGTDHPLKGMVREAVAGERLIYTIGADLQAGWPEAPIPADAVHLVTFAPIGNGGTRMSVTTRLQTTADRDRMLELGHREGFGQSLDRLAALLATH